MPGVPKCDTNIKISPFTKVFLESKFEVRFFLGANVYVLELPTITCRKINAKFNSFYHFQLFNGQNIANLLIGVLAWGDSLKHTKK